jgi:hypothetical protein
MTVEEGAVVRVIFVATFLAILAPSAYAQAHAFAFSTAPAAGQPDCIDGNTAWSTPIQRSQISDTEDDGAGFGPAQSDDGIIPACRQDLQGPPATKLFK